MGRWRKSNIWLVLSRGVTVDGPADGQGGCIGYSNTHSIIMRQLHCRRVDVHGSRGVGRRAGSRTGGGSRLEQPYPSRRATGVQGPGEATCHADYWYYAWAWYGTRGPCVTTAATTASVPSLGVVVKGARSGGHRACRDLAPYWGREGWRQGDC